MSWNINDEVLNTKKFFRSYQILLSHEWVECCINWFRQEQDGTPYTDKQLQAVVYDQWLLLDLRDVEVPQLPPDIEVAKKLVLNDSFALQVMCVVDISRPKLQQLNKIKNLNPLTRGFDDDESTSIAKRMLQLTLTDGVKEIKAIEYKPISSLKLNLSPGSKIMLVGPFTVRRGQVMLEPHNIKLLGGDVEDILVSHAVENVLARLLNLPQNPNPCIVDDNFLNNSRSIDECVQYGNKNSVQSNVTQSYSAVTRSQINTNTSNPKNKNENKMEGKNKNALESFLTRDKEPKRTTNNFFNGEEERRIEKEVDWLLQAERDLLLLNEQTETNINKKTQISLSLNSSIPIPSHSRTTKNSNAQVTTTKTKDIIDFDDDFFTSLDIDKHLNEIGEEIDNDRIYTLTEVCEFVGKRKGKFTTYAKFKSIVQKLTVKHGAWQLTISVECEERELAARVHSDVIVAMIGYTPQQVQEMRTDIQNRNPETANIILKAIESFKSQLLELNCLMEINLSEDIPCIVKLL